VSDLIVGGEWPPTYTLKKSPRAKHVKLKATARHGLELIVPLRFNTKNLPEIFEINKDWIKKQLAKIQTQLALKCDKKIPETVELLSLNQRWQVYYLQGKNKKCKFVVRPQQELVICGEISDEQSILLLNKWIREEAKKYLTLRLNYISQQTQLSFNNLVIRSQQTRWGSCSSTKNINLNYKLIFLPAHLVDHILIHELCHTKNMNHSAKFWRLVSTYDPLWKENNREVRLAEKYVPLWAE